MDTDLEALDLLAEAHSLGLHLESTVPPKKQKPKPKPKPEPKPEPKQG